MSTDKERADVVVVQAERRRLVVVVEAENQETRWRKGTEATEKGVVFEVADDGRRGEGARCRAQDWLRSKAALRPNAKREGDENSYYWQVVGLSGPKADAFSLFCDQSATSTDPSGTRSAARIVLYDTAQGPSAAVDPTELADPPSAKLRAPIALTAKEKAEKVRGVRLQGSASLDRSTTRCHIRLRQPYSPVTHVELRRNHVLDEGSPRQITKNRQRGKQSNRFNVVGGKKGYARR
ncbi:hypothetical protein R3P38DRAFT_2806477 [Favolaschia claudopus]|uniref:Uncharacterized protein n=1 Tax=Favolaschia claudopus TaxID=2862362 RepID=A0AAV9ZJV7_9AGAR